ncbi:MAG: TolC family protein [bacterium]
MKRAIVMAVLSLTASTAGAQQVLTLDQCIGIALENNYGIQRSEQNKIGAEASLEAAHDSFKSRASLSLETPRLYETVNEQFDWSLQLPRWIQEGSTRYLGRLSITQPLPTDGNISLTSTLYRRDLFSNLSGVRQDRDEYSSTLTLSFQQPLFTANSMKLSLRRAELNYELANRRYQRAKWELVYNVTSAFYNLVKAARQVEIDQERAKQSRNSYEMAKLKYNSGLIPEVEALQLEVDLALNEATLSSSQANLEQAEDLLKQALGLDLQESIKVVTRVEYRPLKVDMAKAIEEGFKNRLEIREYTIQRELSELDVKDTERLSEFKGAISAFYNLDGKGDEFEQAIDTDGFNKNRGVTLSFSVPLWDWGKNRAEVEAAQANLKIAELNLEEERKIVERQIRDAVRRLEEAANRVEILKASVEVAQKSYDITRQRFEAGAVTSERLMDAQIALARAKKDDLEALIDYQLALADLKRVTMSDEVGFE